MSHFAIAGMQLELSGMDNRYLIRKEIEKAKRRFPWLQMVVLGELATYGADLAAAEQMPGATESFYQGLARDTDLWLVPGSIYEQQGGAVYNTSFVINPEGEVVGRYRKQFPFCPYEQGVTPGEEFLVFDVPGVGRFGLCICYDQWFPETARQLTWMGAEVILCPTMTNTIDRELELCLARANAISNQCYYFNVNVAGKLGNGRSIAIGPDGQVLHQAGELSETFPLEVDLAHLRRIRERGVFGLCQTLKSFRNSEMAFPVYEPGARKQGPLAELGELSLPEPRN
jgi:predicted amidohydrolase